MDQVPFDELTHARFTALVKTRFRVRVDAEQVELELAEVRQFSPRIGANSQGATLRNECFSLIFSGPSSPYLEQRIYDFQHDELGTFSLFMVPIGKTKEALQYEVVFNRLV